MILLDTNVLSEFMRPVPNAAVQAWLTAQARDRIATTAITVAEIVAGLVRLPDGRRKLRLGEKFQAVLDTGLIVLAFDETAARAYGDIAWAREQAGSSRDMADLMIAAIAVVAGAALATRNVKDFMGCGVEIINPFS